MSEARAVAKQREAVGRPPDVFLWSKMGRWTQRIDSIIRRKELERRAKSGEFWWGIGERAAPNRVSRMWEKARSRNVCFTKTLKPWQGRNSGTVLVWSHYWDGNVLRPIPSNTVMTSFEYERYFALVCGSNSPLVGRRNRGTIFSGQYENLLTGSRRFGQQSTFPVRRVSDDEVGPEYPVEFRARLRSPYCVELECSRPLTHHEIRLLRAVSEPGRTVDDWRGFAARIRAKDKKLA